MADLLLPFVLTWLVHGTILLAGTWMLTTLWRRMPLTLQEALWRAALVGGFFTAGVQLALDWQPVGGRVAVLPPSASAPAVLEQPRHVEHALRPMPGLPTADEGTQPEPEPAAESAAQVAPAPAPQIPWAWGWAAGLIVLAVRGAFMRRRLAKRLAGRRRMERGALLERLQLLSRGAGQRRPIRLSTAEGLGSPLALGVLRPEIVVPLRAARELSDDQLDALLAHELAHHARRDPLWHLVTRALTALFFFQPLHLVARRRLRELSELLADAWAVEQTGGRDALAECLTVVAGWLVRQPAPLAVPAMAARGSMLERRVTRLVNGDSLDGTRRVLALLALAPLLLVALTAPAVAGRGHAALATAPASTPPAAPARSTAGVPPATILDAELAALHEELEALDTLILRVPEPPAALTEGVVRLRARMQQLERDRDTLRTVDAYAKEMPR